MCAASANVLPPANWASYGSSSKSFVQFLQAYTWSVIDPWTFEHEHLRVRFFLEPAPPDFPRDVRKLQHDLRESRRHFLYEDWRSSDRRDAQTCAHIAYSSDRCQAVRSINVMSGAFVIHTRLWVITRNSPDPSTARRPALARS